MIFRKLFTIWRSYLKTTNKIEVALLGYMGDDLSVVNAARVSFDKVSEVLTEGDKKLISYLAKHKHTSPFNHAFLSFRVSAPIFVARQLVKHKFLPWNEVSRRYVDSEPVFYIPEFRKRAENVKQGSDSELVDIHIYHGTQGKNGIEDPFDDSCEIALETYRHLLERNVAPEVARAVLPQTVMTEWVWSGSLGAFLDMLALRLPDDSQKETRDVAVKVYEDVFRLFPVSTEAYLKYARQ